jgi:small ligand-binding sensory domain FIST
VAVAGFFAQDERARVAGQILIHGSTASSVLFEA